MPAGPCRPGRAADHGPGAARRRRRYRRAARPHAQRRAVHELLPRRGQAQSPEPRLRCPGRSPGAGRPAARRRAPPDRLNARAAARGQAPSCRVPDPPRAGWWRSTTSRSRSRPARSWASSASPGAGKSLTGAAIIGLLDPPGRIAGGEIRLRRPADRRPAPTRRCAASAGVRSARSSRIRSPRSTRSIPSASSSSRRSARTCRWARPKRASRAIRLLEETGIPAPSRAPRPVPAPVLGRHAPARRDRAWRSRASPG